MDVDKKLKVFEVAKELFERFGYKKTTVDEIAANAGISKKTLYEIFAGKEKLLSELVIHEGLRCEKMIQNELNDIADPWFKLERYIQISEDYFVSNPFLGKVLCDESGLYAPFLKNEINTIEDGMEKFFIDILSEGTKKGTFGEMDLKTNANCIFVLFRNYTYAGTHTGQHGWVEFIQKAIRN